jgi:hypothetical protein
VVAGMTVRPDSGWPNDGLHIANGLNLNGLTGIECGFHVTLMVAGVIFACFLYVLLHRRQVRLKPDPD